MRYLKKNRQKLLSDGILMKDFDDYPRTKSALIMSIAIPGFSFKRRVE
jgi:hypothetical protein